MANREYKDSVLRTLFKTPKKAKELYCAISGKELSADEKVEVKTLKTVFFSKLRNDLIF